MYLLARQNISLFVVRLTEADDKRDTENDGRIAQLFNVDAGRI